MTVSPARLVRHLRRLTASTSVGAGADAALLDRFVHQRDEAAFADLVKRHGPMVLRLCRRVLGDVHHAEDAFQATFLVLARKAASIRRRDSVAAWLYGVALRVAHKARTSVIAHRPREHHAERPDLAADPLSQLTARELLAVVDEEVQGLPEVYRLPLILCCLEGHTQDEAARLLGWTGGLVKGRLERGRARLEANLARRGLTLSAALTAVLWSRATAAAGVPASLAAVTVHKALAFSVRMPGGASTERVAALAQEGLRDMAATKLKTMLALLLALAVGAVTTAALVARTLPAAGPTATTQGGGQPLPKDAKLPPPDKYGDPLPPGALARLGTVRLRATATAFALSGDGKTLLTCTGGRIVGRLDADTGLLLGEAYLPGAGAQYIWLSADGKTLAVAEDGGVGLWDVAAGKRLHLLPVPVHHLAFAPDGKTLATTAYIKDANWLHLWDMATGKQRLLTNLPSYAHNLTFAPDGQRLFAVVDNHSLRCWDLASGKQLWQNDHAANQLAVAADGKTLCTDTYLGGPLHLWDAQTGKHIAQLGNESLWTGRLAFSPDGKLIAQGTWKETVLWDVASRKVRHRFAGVGPDVVFAHDSQSLFALGTLLLRWDVATGKLLYADTRGHGHIGPVTALAYAPDGRSLATCGEDATVRLWSLADGTHRVLRTDAPHQRIWATTGHGGKWPTSAVFVSFTPDGRQLVTNTAAGPLVVTETATGNTVRQFKLPEPAKNGSIAVAGARLTADGRTLLFLGTVFEQPTSSIRLEHEFPLRGWDLATGKEVVARTVTGPLLDSVEFSPDGRLLVLPHFCRLQDVKTGGQRGLVDAPVDLGETFAFSPDGRLLAVTEPGRLTGPATAVRIYEVLTGRQIMRVEAPLGLVPALAFSLDGRLLAAAGTDALHVWQATTGKRLMHLPAKGRLTHWTPDAFAISLAFAPDGRSLATGHNDGTVLVWDLAPAGQAMVAPPGPVDASACWDALAGVDAAKAWSAIDQLSVVPGQALALLRQKLRPVKVDPQWLAARLADLDSDKFAVRTAATRELEQVAELVESELRRVLEKPASEEVRRRLLGILKLVEAARMDWRPPGEVRDLRAVTVLERIGSEETRALLRELAAGAPDAGITQAARAALQRLAK
jgi:RNA polymerase sigma factor (sigma-70 family)